jgi:cytochrome c553
MPRAPIFAIILAALGASPACAQGAGASLAYGRHLAQECGACHLPAAAAGGIPVIAGKPAAEIADLLHAFREGRRTNPVMVSVAKSLDETQIAALAAYFASLPPPAGSTSRR